MQKKRTIHVRCVSLLLLVRFEFIYLILDYKLDALLIILKLWNE